MKYVFPRNVRAGGTQRGEFKDALEYAAWCHDVPVKEAIEYYGHYLGARFIRVYYKTWMG